MGCAQSPVPLILSRTKITVMDYSQNHISSSFLEDPVAAKAHKHKTSSEITSSNISPQEIFLDKNNKKEENLHKLLVVT